MKRVSVDVIVTVDDDCDEEDVEADVTDLVQRLTAIDEYKTVEVWCEDVDVTVDEKIALSLSRVTEIDKNMVNSIIAGVKANDF